MDRIELANELINRGVEILSESVHKGVDIPSDEIKEIIKKYKSEKPNFIKGYTVSNIPKTITAGLDTWSLIGNFEKISKNDKKELVKFIANINKELRKYKVLIVIDYMDKSDKTYTGDIGLSTR